MYFKRTLIIENAHLYSTFPSLLLSLSPILRSTQPALPSAIVLIAPATFLSIAYSFLCNTKCENISTLAQIILSFGNLLPLSFKSSTVTLQLLSWDNRKEHLRHAWGHGDVGCSIHTNISPVHLQLGLQWSSPCWFSEACASTGSNLASHWRTNPVQRLF